MSLREVRPGLRVINKSNHVSKVSLNVAAGDELEVSEDVAAQLAAQNLDFVSTDHDDAAKAPQYPPPVEEPETEEAPAEEVEKPKPTRARSKRRS
jgi:hypothetical protein